MNGVSLPSDFPTPVVNVMNDPAPGHIFLNIWGRGSAPFIMILKNSGVPIYYKKVSERTYDFKVQPTDVLTHFDRELGGFVVMDSTYTVIDTIRCGNGYSTDEHELRILPNGHALLLASDWKQVDMSKIVDGGKPNATVRGNHVQELDASGNVVFEWQCWDHFHITDSEHENLKASSIDFTHMNAIDVDHDGNLLISNRNLSEITKINRDTGEIIWRLGGANNQFTFVNDPFGISYQHSIRALPNGNYLLFDNGNYHSPQFSRAVEYELDLENMTATLVWQYRNDPDYFAPFKGNIQRLPNGNTLINWAYPNTPKLTEVRPDYSKAYEFNFEEPVSCYRTFRLPWEGKAAVPYLIAESHTDRVMLIFNKFGDPDVKKYIVYGGTSPAPVSPIDSTEKPLLELTNLKNHTRYYFRVTAVNNNFQESGYSNEESLVVRYANPGDNLIVNGDFAAGTDFWELKTDDSADAEANITANGTYHLKITDGGSYYRSIQLIQNNIELIQGKEYLLEFTAYADSPRTIDTKIEKIFEPWTKYGKIGSSYLTQTPTHYSYQFVMENLSDHQARTIFDCGFYPHDIYFENISLTMQQGSSINDENGKLPLDYELYNSFPNPFSPGGRHHSIMIRYALSAKSKVKLTIYNLLGERMNELVHRIEKPGIHTASFDCSSLPTGIYFCLMSATSASNSTTFTKAIKITLLK